MAQNIYSLRRDIVEAGRRIYNKGFVASNDGNISARLDDNRVMITPTGVSKGFMKPEDMVIVDMEGKVLNGDKRPSSEVFMHLQIYEDRPDVNSVCHSHPPYATGFAVAGLALDQCVLPEVIIVLGDVPLVEYGTPGTEDFYKPVRKYLKDHDAFLLANHGTLTIGTDVFNAYYKTETLEHFAKIAFIAKQLGQVNVLDKKDATTLFDARARYGIQSTTVCKTCEEEGVDACVLHGTGDPTQQSAKTTSPDPQQTTAVNQDEIAKIVTEAVLKQLA